MDSRSGPAAINEALPGRKLTSWIESFLDFTAELSSPEIFRIWSGISTIAGALERRVWSVSNAGVLYPNMFILLVANPGVGKDQAIDPGRDLWAATGKLKVAPVSMSHKGLLDELADPSSQKNYVDKTGEWIKYHSLLIAVPELGVILPKHDLGQLSLFNELFECKNIFEERIRGAGVLLSIERPHVHLIAGTQPKYMQELFPEAAFGMGFTARVILVYAGSPVKSSLFNERPSHSTLYTHLLQDLRQIADLRGQFRFTSEAAAAIESWHMEGADEDKPTHSKLIHYNARRVVHVLKLCQVHSVSRGDDLVITLEDFEWAKKLLLYTEAAMPEIFKEMASGGQLDQLEEAFHHLIRLYHISGKKPVPEHKLVHFLSARVPANQISYLIETMLRANMIREVSIGSVNDALPQSVRRRVFEPLTLNVTE